MMQNGLYDHGYGTDWKDVLVYRREGYTTSVADLHEHSYYEMNLIFSGNVRILLSEQTLETTTSHLVLVPPGTAHFISCKPDTLYRRLYLSFSARFVERDLPEWPELRRLFGRKGRIVAVDGPQQQLCERIIGEIGKERNLFRRRMLVYYLLSHLADIAGSQNVELTATPPYIVQALSYINDHYAEKILAEDLARRLHIGRTTLMTAFKKYTGSSLNRYLINHRLKRAVPMLRAGMPVQEAAERCGFGDSGTLIRHFRDCFGVTPGRFQRDVSLLSEF